MTAPADFQNALILTPALQGPPGVPGAAGDWQIFGGIWLAAGQLQVNQPWTFVDMRGATGPGSLLFPNSAALLVNQWYVIVNGFASAQAITLTPPAGVTCWDPSTPGTYRTGSGTLATIAGGDGKPYRFKYSATLTSLIPW